MIGTNRELKLIQRISDCRIWELTQFGDGAPDPDWISAWLTALARQRIVVLAILANQRIEGAKKVVSLSHWFTGNSALSGGPVARAGAEHTGQD
jgi:hypothetical protein